MKKVLTYGTFDLLHIGHINFLKRARALGDYLIVGLSTDAFNATQGQKTTYPYDERKAILSALRFVDVVIPERTLEQKLDDITEYEIDVLAMGDIWRGELTYLTKVCDIAYLPQIREPSA